MCMVARSAIVSVVLVKSIYIRRFVGENGSHINKLHETMLDTTNQTGKHQYA